MKRTTFLLAVGALTLSLVAAGAEASVSSFFECGSPQIVPAERVERNPVIKTIIVISFTVSNKFTNFDVEHYMADGAVYKRGEQYRNIELRSTKERELWSGVLITNPAITMVGTLSEVNVKGTKQVRYVERQYRNGRLVVTITSICRGIDVEDLPPIRKDGD